MTEPITIVDVGGRFGLHPSLNAFKGIGTFHMFEPDPEEASRLTSVYSGPDDHVTVHAMALMDKPGELTLKLRQHRALSSFYDFNEELFGELNYMENEISAVSEISVPVDTIDNMFAEERINILKTDTEGADFHVLNGAEEQLKNNVIALRSEVTFTSVIPGQPMFGEINRLVYDLGFQLLNMDYAGQGVTRTPYTRLDRFGQLLTTDATWVKRDEFLYADPASINAQDILVLARFLFSNHATDVAMWHLNRAVELCPGLFDQWRDTLIYEGVRRDVAKLIKDLSYVPGARGEDLTACYEAIFSRTFPPIYEYYYHFGA